MSVEDRIRPGANQYVSAEHALDELPDLLTPFHHPVIITGDKSYAAFTAHSNTAFDYPVLRYDGSASDEDGQHLADQAPDADVIIGIGGGRVLDTAKVSAEVLATPIITVPTLASNCAPYTPIGAIYHQDHTFKRVAYFSQAPYATVVDWSLILDAPRDYFIAGIGDTLAKWYEIQGIVATLDQPLPAFNHLGYLAAQNIREVITDHALNATHDFDDHHLTQELVDVIDAIIGIAGTVGGFAVAYGRTSGAHAIHNGLSYINETHAILHGSKVAYGILVQLAYTGQTDEIESLLPLYHALGLPTTLADLNVTTQPTAPVAEWAAQPQESFKLIDPAVTPDKIEAAIEAVEKVTTVAH
ncbi:iron-containing alcohol dehydrogenase family protein [Lacticaseibacillus saniviri]